jgi:hypothetical protein
LTLAVDGVECESHLSEIICNQCPNDNKCIRFINKQGSVIIGFEVSTKAAIKITTLCAAMLAAFLLPVPRLDSSPNMKKAIHSLGT